MANVCQSVSSVVEHSETLMENRSSEEQTADVRALLVLLVFSLSSMRKDEISLSELEEILHA